MSRSEPRGPLRPWPGVLRADLTDYGQADEALAKAKGLIINKSSMASYQPATAYGITKACLNVFTHAMASQFGADEIRCCAIAPGLMETPASAASAPPTAPAPAPRRPPTHATRRSTCSPRPRRRSTWRRR